MILPQPRLIVWACAWAVPAAVVTAVAPAASDVALLAVAVAMLLPVLDAVFSYGRLGAVRVALPDTVRVTQGEEAVLPLRIDCDGRRPSLLRIGLPMPPDLAGQNEDQTIRLPAQESCQVQFLCRPRQRGRYRLERCYLGVLSAGGFWLHRGLARLDAEIRVYPDLSHEKRHLAGLFLNRGGIGMHPQRQIGHGRDFEQLREYVHGDSYDEISWKATARRGAPITKVFQLERTQEVYVVIDSSRLSARTTWQETPPGAAVPQAAGAQAADNPPGQTSLDRFIAAAMVVGMVAERQGDRFGVLSFSDKVDNFIRANTGKEHYRTCRESIYALQSRAVTPDFTELFSFLRIRLRGRALLVVLTDLDDPILAQSLQESVSVVTRKHLVMVNMIQPPGVDEIFSDQAAATVDQVYADLVGHLQYSGLLELQKVLRQRGVGFYLTHSAALCTDVIRQYLSIKKRQLL